MADSIATFEDFLNSFNDEELSDLSNLHLPGTKEIDKAKIEYMLRRAASDWLSWFDCDSYQIAPKIAVGSAVTCEIAIARRNLDFNAPRESVQQQYEFCYQISRDWKTDQLKAGNDSPGDNTPIFSAFSI